MLVSFNLDPFCWKGNIRARIFLMKHTFYGTWIFGHVEPSIVLDILTLKAIYFNFVKRPNATRFNLDIVRRVHYKKSILFNLDNLKHSFGRSDKVTILSIGKYWFGHCYTWTVWDSPHWVWWPILVVFLQCHSIPPDIVFDNK